MKYNCRRLFLAVISTKNYNESLQASVPHTATSRLEQAEHASQVGWVNKRLMFVATLHPGENTVTIISWCGREGEGNYFNGNRCGGGGGGSVIQGYLFF